MEQVKFLESNGALTNPLRVDHGMTHSVYITDPNGYGVEFVYDLPKEVWEGDIDAALNWVKPLPTEGAEALEDRTQGIPSFGRAAE